MKLDLERLSVMMGTKEKDSYSK